ncbi:MAG: hypothetical protein WD036_05000 [Bauldia sp.]
MARSTHSQRLERWLGAEQVNRISAQFRDFYYPVAVHGVPGNVRVMPGGGFAGEVMAGEYFSAEDRAAEVMKKILRAAEAKVRRHRALGTLIELIRAGDRRLASVGAFASIDAVVAAYTGGKGQVINFQKTGVAANAKGNANDLWSRAGTPPAGGAGSAAPGGVAPTVATTGALTFANLGAANSGHYLNWSLSASVINNSLLLYDRLFAVVKTMNSTATQAVTGVPTRYQNTAAGNVQYIGGNFCFPANPTTVLAATAHNWTVCTYTDQGGAAGTFPSMTGVSACVVGGVDLSVGNWFMSLAAADVGVGALTQMQCSALVATGTIDFVIGHPIAVNACPIANLACLDDGLYTSLNLTPIIDSACLSFLEMRKPATTATTYSGILRAVSE